MANSAEKEGALGLGVSTGCRSMWVQGEAQDRIRSGAGE